MKYIRNTTDFYIEENTVLSLGKFDGIHRGHEQLLQYFAKKKDEGLAGAIFTFDALLHHASPLSSAALAL